MLRRGLWGVLVGCLLFSAVPVMSQAQLSGSSRLDLAAFPVVCTQVSEIKLDTPCERTLLKFDIESRMNLNVTFSGMVLSLDSAIGIAGPEHLILTLTSNLGAVTLKPELWFAVPFETVLDANQMMNVVVIPPGDVLFVKKRFTVQMSVAGISVEGLGLFEDVTFPNPGADYGKADCDGDSEVEGTCVNGVETNDALHYENQAFGFGAILKLQGQTVSGITLTSLAGFCADQGGNSVKKFSASGRVDPACLGRGLRLNFETISVGGLAVGGFPVSLSFNYTSATEPKLSAAAGVSFELLNVVTVNTSLTLGPPNLGAFSLRLNMDALTVNLSFTNFFQFTGASANFGTTLSVGSLVTAFSSNLSARAGDGLTAVGMSLSVSQGTFSAVHSAAWTRQQVGTDGGGDPIYGLRFARLNLRFNLRFSPAVISLEATFGQSGLTRFALITGLVF